MENAAATNHESGAQQLRLLSVPEPTPLESSPAHTRFRLSRATRERGLRHVAEIREQLAAAKAARESQNVTPLPRRRPRRPAA